VALIREAVADDLDALVALRATWVAERRGPAEDPDFPQRFAAWFERERPQRAFWLAEAGGAAIGMTNLLTFERMPGAGADIGRWGYLANMFVLADHRGHGVGRQLLDAVVADGDARGLVRIVLSPSDRSVPFYRRAGFGDAGELLLRRRLPVAGSGDAAP
jgi:GNAT superfamily N-acetyltransferase